MWSISPARPLGSLSVRRFTLFVLATLMVLFAIATPAQAQLVDEDGRPKATWSGDTITFQGQDFKKLDARPPLDGSVCESRSVIYAHFAREGGSSGSVIEARIICFNDTDKTKDIYANVLTFADATSETEYGDRIMNETSTIVAAEGTTATDSEETITNCSSIHTKGLGWFICPLTNWLSAGMDQLYNILSSFLIVTPLTTTRSGVLYYMWGIMQNLANILFIIGFLVVIYSQITSAGISNYGIKRLLPRLIIAAVLVNISYWIAAIAVDLSNILGMSLQNLFIEVRDNIPASEVQEVGSSSWESMALTVLAGGAAAGGAIVGVAASAGGSLWFLLVGVVGAMVSAMVAILVLAARQALITILIIISPLAFVAYLLPSTEKYFDRWRSIFTTMLVMFPIFSVVFGGASLAGVAIIYSADPSSTNYYNIVILGMIVQVAPVVITPLLIKLSGSLLGRIAGIVNDPNKGIVDKTRKYAQGRHDFTKNRQISDKDSDGRYKNTNPLASIGRRMAVRDEHRSQQVKAWEGGLAAAYAQDARSHDTHRQSAINEMLKSEGDSRSKTEVQRDIARTTALRTLYGQQHLSQEEAENAETANKLQFELHRTDPSLETDATARAVYESAQAAERQKRANTMRQTTMSAVQEEHFYEELNVNAALQNEVGATEIDDVGAMRAKTVAQSKMMTASGERKQRYKENFGFENVHPTAILDIATGRVAAADNDQREAAIESVFESSNHDAILKLFEQLDLTPATDKSFRQTVSGAALKSSAKPIFASGRILGENIPQGDVTLTGPALIDQWMVEATEKHKYDTETLATKISKDEIIRLKTALITNGGRGRLATGVETTLRDDIRRAFKDTDMFRALGDRKGDLISLGRELGLGDNDFDPNTP